MCGIAGWIDYNKNLNEEDGQMDAMSEKLAPRGPDESGSRKTAECYFVHRRLIILDKENGKQPIIRGQGSTKYIMTYNGQLYNTEEIKSRLIKLGYVFNGYSDTEVVLSAYMAWGEKCLDEFNGIFALAIWNDSKKTLFAARDRVGVKPFFYYVYDGGFIFASEIKALLRHRDIRPDLDSEGAASIMLLGPARKCGNGVFKNIKELLPGQYATFSRDGLKTAEYWSLKAQPHNESLEETASHIRELLVDSIERQLISDVPLCTFLSGGLDSSIISAVAAKKFQSEGRRLSTCSVDYKDNRVNFKASMFQPDEDAPWINEMVNYIGSEHHDIVIDTPRLAEALLDAVKARDLPGMADIDSSLYLFVGEVRKKFTVGLSGECADELFAGYPWYNNDELLFYGGFPWSRSTKERAALLRENAIGGIDPAEYVAAAYNETVTGTDYLDSDSKKDRRIREMFRLNYYWFMQTLIDRNDRMCAANGLEARVPLCDYRIVEYAYNIPWELKSFGQREKGLIRYAMENYLPRDVAWRKKSPYPKTHNPTYFKAVLECFGDIISKPDCRLSELLDMKKMRTLFETEGKSFEANWYGQLMGRPQLFAYLIQMEYWLREYNINIIK